MHINLLIKNISSKPFDKTDKYSNTTFGEPIVVAITVTKRNLIMKNHRIIMRNAAVIFMLYTPMDLVYADKDMTVKIISSSYKFD